MLRITKTETGMVHGLPGTDARITVYKGIPNLMRDNMVSSPKRLV